VVHRDAGAEMGQGASKAVERNGNLQVTKQIVANYFCFCSATMLTSTIITEIIENHS